VAELGAQGVAPPSGAKVVGYPTAGYAELYAISAVVSCRTDAEAEDSFAAIRARNKFGIAMAAIIRMIATTINNSINENPCSRFIATILSRCICMHFEYRLGPVEQRKTKLFRMNKLESGFCRILNLTKQIALFTYS
jgi:hypothetical protein